MSAVFADTAFYVAVASTRDALHQTALEFIDGFDGLFVTTEFVLIEVANFLSRIDKRQFFIRLMRDLRVSPSTEVIPTSQDLFQRGFDLFESRMDKQWSLTDCTSFVVMAERAITDALASDRHFVQAGFRALLTKGEQR